MTISTQSLGKAPRGDESANGPSLDRPSNCCALMARVKQLSSSIAGAMNISSSFTLCSRSSSEQNLPRDYNRLTLDFILAVRSLFFLIPEQTRPPIDWNRLEFSDGDQE